MSNSCFTCSFSVLYPDGCLRCEEPSVLAKEHITGPLATKPCSRYNLGTGRIYQIDIEKHRKMFDKIQKQKVKVTEVKPVKTTKRTSTQQGRLF